MELGGPVYRQDVPWSEELRVFSHPGIIQSGLACETSPFAMAFLVNTLVVISVFLNSLRIVSALALSDSWRDADLGQSSYLGGNHNMDPSVVDSPQFGQLWKVPFNNKEKVEELSRG